MKEIKIENRKLKSENIELTEANKRVNENNNLLKSFGEQKNETISHIKYE